MASAARLSLPQFEGSFRVSGSCELALAKSEQHAAHVTASLTAQRRMRASSEVALLAAQARAGGRTRPKALLVTTGAADAGPHQTGAGGGGGASGIGAAVVAV